jgi:hypothetical protein
MRICPVETGAGTALAGALCLAERFMVLRVFDSPALLGILNIREF